MITRRGLIGWAAGSLACLVGLKPSEAKPTNKGVYRAVKGPVFFEKRAARPINEGVRRDVIELRIIRHGEPDVVETLTITNGEVSYEGVENGNCRITVTSRDESFVAWRFARRAVT